MYNAEMPNARISAGHRSVRWWPLAALAALWLAGGVVGCGQTGPLYLPADPATESPEAADENPPADEADESGDDAIES